MNFLDFIWLISHGTLIKIVDQDLKTIFWGRSLEFRASYFDDSSTYHGIVNFGKVVNVFTDDSTIVIVVYLPY